MRYWIYVVRKENFEITSENQFSLIGFPERKMKMAKEVNVGDKVVLYIASGVSKIPGILEIKSDYYESREWIWDDTFPIRLKTKPYIILKKDKFLDMRKLKDKLHFIKNKEVWKVYFMHALKEIDEKDYKVIEQHALKVK